MSENKKVSLEDFLTEETFKIFYYKENNLFGPIRKVQTKLSNCKSDSIWLNARANQANSIVEYLPDLLRNSNNGREKNVEETLYGEIDNVKNINGIIDFLIENIKNYITHPDNLSGKKTQLVLVVNNAQNLYFSSGSTDQGKIISGQWEHFFSEFLMLNDNNKKNSFKIILLTSELLPPVKGWEEFCCRRIISAGRDNKGTVPENRTDCCCISNKINSIKRIVPSKKERLNFEEELELTVFGHRLLNNLLNHTAMENCFAFPAIMETICNTFRASKDEEGNTLFDLMFRWGYGDQFVDFIERYASADDRRIKQYTEIIDKSFESIINIVPGLKKDDASSNTDVSVSSNTDVDQKNRTSIKHDLLIITKVVAFFRLLQLIKTKIKDRKPKDKEKDSERLSIAVYMARLLCLPVTEYMFSDVGALLQNYGYIDFLKEIFSMINPELKEINSLLFVRLKVIEGGIYYYNYPEDYIKALECYTEAYSVLYKETRKLPRPKDKGERSCSNFKKNKICPLFSSLVDFCLIRVFHQLLKRDLLRYFKPEEQKIIEDNLKIIRTLFGKISRFAVFVAESFEGGLTAMVRHTMKQLLWKMEKTDRKVRGYVEEEGKGHNECFKELLLENSKVENPCILLEKNQLNVIRKRINAGTLKYFMVSGTARKNILYVSRLLKRNKDNISENDSHKVQCLKNQGQEEPEKALNWRDKVFQLKNDFILHFIQPGSKKRSLIKKILYFLNIRNWTDFYWEFLVLYYALLLLLEGFKTWTGSLKKEHYLRIKSPIEKHKFNKITSQLETAKSYCRKINDKHESFRLESKNTTGLFSIRSGFIHELTGDYYYLKAGLLDKESREKELRDAFEQYEKAAAAYEKIDNGYYMEKCRKKISRQKKESGFDV